LIDLTHGVYLITVNKEERYKSILSGLTETGSITYHEMAVALRVSADTIRRDIEALHRNGLLFKVRNGAIPINKNPFTFQDRAGFAADEKTVIGIKTQQLLKKGMTVFMDGGTTMCEVARHLPPDTSLRIITNNLALVPILSQHQNIELIILGGTYNRSTETTIGAKTCEDAERFIADVYLMGTCAISKTFGITAALQEDGEVKRAMLKRSKQVIVLSHSDKIGEQEYFKVCDLDKINILISELPGDDPKLDDLRFLNLKII
jgi:DeoR family transcriptional regulator, carbon catabolite repression regulator